MWYTCHTHHWSQIHTFYKSYQFSHLSPLNPSTFFCIDKFFHQFFPCNYTLFLMILLSARIFELKNTLTTNKLECFYNSYYIYRFTLSATHSGGWGRPQSAFWYPNAMFARYFRTLFKETIPSVQPFYINSHPYYLSSPSAVSAFYLFYFYSLPVIFRRIDSKISVQTTRYTKP